MCGIGRQAARAAGKPAQERDILPNQVRVLRAIAAVGAGGWRCFFAWGRRVTQHVEEAARRARPREKAAKMVSDEFGCRLKKSGITLPLVDDMGTGKPLWPCRSRASIEA